MQRKVPHVLIVDNSIDVTGALNAILQYAEYARGDFYFVFVLPNGSRATNKVKEKGFIVEELPLIEIGKNWRNLLLYLPYLFINALRLKKLIKLHQVTLVHVNDFYNLIGVAAKLIGGSFKLITHVRFMPDRFPAILVRLWIKLNLLFANAIVCVSHAVKNLLPNHHKIQVIYDGLSDVKIISKQEIKSEPYLKLLYLAHYIPGKGQNFALEAFYKAYHHNLKLRLKFVGGDMGLPKNKVFKEKLINRSRELELQEAVRFFGPASDVNLELAQADIILNFSESESFSMTCLEALMAGKPLIATNCGGPVELFEQGNSGWLVPNRDINAMCKAILQLSEDGDLRKKLCMNSSNYVKAKFSEKNTSAKLFQLYLDKTDENAPAISVI